MRTTRGRERADLRVTRDEHGDDVFHLVRDALRDAPGNVLAIERGAAREGRDARARENADIDAAHIRSPVCLTILLDVKELFEVLRGIGERHAGDIFLVVALLIRRLRPHALEARAFTLGVSLRDADEKVAAAHRHGRRVRRQHGGRNRREERAHENAENADDDEQLDECKSLFVLVHLCCYLRLFCW